MADELAYVTRLAAWLARSMSGAEPLFLDFYTDEVGASLPDAVRQAPAVTSALQHTSIAAHDFQAVAAALDGTAGDESRVAAALVQLGARLGAFFTALGGLASAVDGAVTPATVPDPAERAAAQAFAGDLAGTVGEYVLASGITDQTPELGFVLTLLGLMDWRRVAATPGDPLSRDHIKKSLELHRFKDLVSDPAGHFARAHRWGQPDFNPSHLFDLYRGFFKEEDALRVGEKDGDPFLKYGFFVLSRDRTLTPPGLRLRLEATHREAIERRVRLGSSAWGITLAANLTMSGAIGGTVTPPLEIALLPAEGDIGGEVTATFDRNRDARPFPILGGSGALALAATNLAAGVGLATSWDLDARTARINPLLFAKIEKLTLKINADRADSFVGSLLSSAKIEGEFDLGLEWTADRGLKITASGGIEISLPIHQKLGPIELAIIYLALRIKEDGTLSLEASAALGGKLGPLAATLDRIGAQLDMRFAEGADADFGPFDLGLSFKPPNGVGLSLDAGAVRGGGYLFFDFDRGEYAGVVQLSILNMISITAIGMIATRMPDGSEGFSLLVIISVEFNPGIQLGLGFTLIGLGGLVGLNRTMMLEPLVMGVRTGTINSILFPQGDIIANAPRIISDLRAIFPPARDRFLIGPMAKLGWGTPTLVSVSLGIVIEIPGNLAILGVLRLNLPAPDAPLIVLQVAFVGAIEFDKKRLWFFASLFESRILFITLEGELGLLLGWGDDPTFVFSAGGFHPRFTPPPLPFPSPQRLSISILNQPAAMVRIQSYFAVTSNTVQFGSSAELRFGFDSFGIQGHFGYDALFQFSPFHFIISANVSLSLRVAGLDLLSVRVDLGLEGPTPWHAYGTGHISLLFFEISADFDVTWGDSADTTLPPIAILPLLRAEVGKRENWTAALPTGSRTLVSLRAQDEAAGELVMHPQGTLRFSQRLLPLRLPLDKLGAQKPSDARRFELVVTSPALESKGDVREDFAMAQFQALDDATKLSRPSFEKQPGGLDMGAAGSDLRADHMVLRVVRYEEIIIDGEFRKHPALARPSGMFVHHIKGAAIAHSALSHARSARLNPFGQQGIEVRGEPHVVADVDSNRTITEFASAAEARAHMARLIDDDRTLSAKLHVIPAYEAA